MYSGQNNARRHDTSTGTKKNFDPDPPLKENPDPSLEQTKTGFRSNIKKLIYLSKCE